MRGFMSLTVLPLLGYYLLGIGILNNERRSRNHCGFFVRKISVLHHYVGLGGQSKDWPVLVPVCQPAQSGAMIGIMSSGLKPYTRQSS